MAGKLQEQSAGLGTGGAAAGRRLPAGLGPAIQALADFAAERAWQGPQREQIKIYSALGHTLQGRRARATARRIARALSRAAALQLELSSTLKPRRRG